MLKGKSRYYVRELHVIDTESNPSKQIYIREILDSTSCEFMMSKLGVSQKLDIIAELGLDYLTQILHESYVNKGVASCPGYNAKQDAALAFLDLRKSAGEINQQEYSRLLKDIIMAPLLSGSREE